MTLAAEQTQSVEACQPAKALADLARLDGDADESFQAPCGQVWPRVSFIIPGSINLTSRCKKSPRWEVWHRKHRLLNEPRVVTRGNAVPALAVRYRRNTTLQNSKATRPYSSLNSKLTTLRLCCIHKAVSTELSCPETHRPGSPHLNPGFNTVYRS